MTFVYQLECKGFEVGALADGKIEISPASRLTDEIRNWIRQHRAQILAELHHQEQMGVVLFYKGLTKQQSSHLMDLMRTRDAQSDDRRLCAECQHSHYIESRLRCQKRLSPFGESTIYTLHRCSGFELNKIKEVTNHGN